MNKTADFQLTQWEKTDRIMMEDFQSRQRRHRRGAEEQCRGRGGGES
ncbi:MAG: hypothetical protein ACLU38_13605 [Dysosmobacter sp.]